MRCDGVSLKVEVMCLLGQEGRTLKSRIKRRRAAVDILLNV